MHVAYAVSTKDRTFASKLQAHFIITSLQTIERWRNIESAPIFKNVLYSNDDPTPMKKQRPDSLHKCACCHRNHFLPLLNVPACGSDLVKRIRLLHFHPLCERFTVRVVSSDRCHRVLKKGGDRSRRPVL